MLDHRHREPAEGVLRLVLPLPFPGLGRVNAYLLRDPAGDTLIDCGIYMPTGEDDHGWADVVAALKACDSSPEKVSRLVITHPHIDHYGMAGRFLRASGCELWMHEAWPDDIELYRDPAKSAHRVREMLIDHGVAIEQLDEITAFEDWTPFLSEIVEPTTSASDGDVFPAGGRRWEIIHTPGHARSHVCVWSANGGILVSGDHLLPSITPHIDFKRGEDADPLGDFLRSLARVERLGPQLVLPGHGHPFADGAERARAIARHHDRRLGSILQVIRREPHTAEEITNEIFTGELLNFEKRLALGEALAHLAYLRHAGEVERVRRDDGVLVYRKAQRRRDADRGE